MTVEGQAHDRPAQLVDETRVPKQPPGQVRRSDRQVEVLAHLEHVQQRIERCGTAHLVVGRLVAGGRSALLGHVTPSNRT
jgi:hypothetical protein